PGRDEPHRERRSALAGRRALEDPAHQVRLGAAELRDQPLRRYESLVLEVIADRHRAIDELALTRAAVAAQSEALDDGRSLELGHRPEELKHELAEGRNGARRRPSHMSS